MRVSIVIPTYNERENIDKLLSELLILTGKLRKHKFTILIVDDNSPDKTADVVRAFQKKSSDVKLLSGKKQGLGNAMVRGYMYAMAHFMPEVVVTNEADFGFSFDKNLKLMLSLIEKGADVVVASRHVGIGKSKGWTLSRRLNHFVANTLFARYVAGVTKVYDHNGAFRAIRVRGVLDSIGLSKMKVSGFAFFFYQIYLLTKVTDKIEEFPCVFRFRTKGESKVSFNPKYIKTYVKDIAEYAAIAFKIRFGIV